MKRRAEEAIRRPILQISIRDAEKALELNSSPRCTPLRIRELKTQTTSPLREEPIHTRSQRASEKRQFAQPTFREMSSTAAATIYSRTAFGNSTAR